MTSIEKTRFLSIRILKRLLQNLLIFVISLFIALLIAEWTVYLLFKEKIVLFPRYVQEVQHNQFRIRGNIPNAHYKHKSYDGTWEFSINSNGFRNSKDFNYNKNEGVLRILVLGDSFTIGYEAKEEETYASVIEKYLNEKGIAAEVLNAGVSGYGSAEELIFLENEGIKYQPDYIILGYYKNDIVNNLMSNIFALKNNELVIENKEYIPAIKMRNFLNSFAIYRWLSEHSYLQNYVRTYLSSKIQNKIIKQNKKKVQSIVDMQQSIETYNIDLTEALIKKMYSIANKNGAKFILLDIPHRSLKPNFPLKPESSIDDLADIFVDAAYILRKYEGNKDLYRPHGHGHWTETAHSLIGKHLGNIIFKQNMLFESKAN